MAVPDGPGLFTAGCPVHPPPVGVVDGALRAHPALGYEIAGFALHGEVSAVVGDECERADRGRDGAFVEREVDRGAVLRLQGDGRVQIGETPGAFIDRDEDQDAAEPILVIKVDGQVLAGGDGAGAVVPVEMDIRGCPRAPKAFPSACTTPFLPSVSS